MARSRTAAADATAVNVTTGSSKCAISSILITLQDGSNADGFLQLFNNSSPTVGTTVPTAVVPIAKTVARTMLGQTIKGKKRLRIVTNGPEGGIIFDAGLSYAVTTTATGNTSPATVDKPEVIVYYQPISGTFTGQ